MYFLSAATHTHTHTHTDNRELWHQFHDEWGSPVYIGTRSVVWRVGTDP